MAGVLKVTRVVLSMAATETSDTYVYTPEVSSANAIPFRSGAHYTDTPLDENEFDHIMTDVYFSGNTLTVERGAAASSGIDVHVTIVEFDSSLVDVQSGTWQMLATAGTDTETPTGNPALADTLVLAYGKGDATGRISETNGCSFRFRLYDDAGTRRIGLSRDSTTGQLDGHWFTAEALSGQFTVDHEEINMITTDSSKTATVGSVTTGKTFIISSQEMNGTGDDNDRLPRVELTNGTTITATRQATGGTVDIYVQAVEFSGGESVTRGERYQTTATTTDDFDPGGTWDMTVAMPWIPSNLSHKNANMPGTGNDNNVEAFVRMGLVDNNTVRLQHFASLETNNYITWEIVEWEIGTAGASRRVMVIS